MKDNCFTYPWSKPCPTDTHLFSLTLTIHTPFETGKWSPLLKGNTSGVLWPDELLWKKGSSNFMIHNTRILRFFCVNCILQPPGLPGLDSLGLTKQSDLDPVISKNITLSRCPFYSDAPLGFHISLKSSPIKIYNLCILMLLSLNIFYSF